MIRKNLTPAAYIIRIFGGVRATARALDRSPASVSKWTKPKDDKGTGGHIPSRAAREIMAKAITQNLDITPYDILYGREVLE